MDTKICTVCGCEKELSSYAKRTGRSARRGTCRSCQRKKSRTENPSLAELNPDREVPAGEELPARRKRRRRRKSRSAEQKLDTLSLDENGAALEESAVVSGMAEEMDKSIGISNPAKRKRKRRRRRKAAPSSAQEIGISSESPEIAEEAGQEPPEAEPVKRKRKRKRRRKSGGAAQKLNALQTDSAQPLLLPPRRHIEPLNGPFTFDTNRLNDRGSGVIKLRGRRESGKRWHTDIDTAMAVRMVKEGAAGIVNSRTIHKLYTKSDFRIFVLQRDNYVCKYCGRYGDTIDHVLPKSKGGLSTPDNCVCACSSCNLHKADKLTYTYSRHDL
ncbi:HNH endonuclease [Paenibacillus sp. GCM10023252]|uniref:HNH endonuclease n=1 Tax=Paenibacillus sp. GCM10023252 TaxID=3252649 RepID=UPI003621607D